MRTVCKEQEAALPLAVNLDVEAERCQIASGFIRRISIAGVAFPQYGPHLVQPFRPASEQRSFAALDIDLQKVDARPTQFRDTDGMDMTSTGNVVPVVLGL